MLAFTKYCSMPSQLLLLVVLLLTWVANYTFDCLAFRLPAYAPSLKQQTTGALSYRSLCAAMVSSR